MASTPKKKVAKKPVPVSKKVPARKSTPKKAAQAPTRMDLPAILAEVPIAVLIAEQERRIALRIQIEEIPQHILDSKIERRRIASEWTVEQMIY